MAEITSNFIKSNAAFKGYLKKELMTCLRSRDRLIMTLRKLRRLKAD